MVRINIIEPKLLSDQHLRAEYVEILMLFSTAHKYNADKVPAKYCLGKGHINFFKNKLEYLSRRFIALKEEFKARGFKANKYIKDYVRADKLLEEQFGNWSPDEEDYKIIIPRIISRLEKKPHWYSYYGKRLTMEQWQEMYGVKE